VHLAVLLAQLNAPVPASCTPDVNAKLAQLVANGERRQVDDVMVCGTTISASRTQYGREHGDHQLLTLRVLLPGVGARLVQVATNDDLDGVVTAPAHVPVFAYGQYYAGRGRFAAGLHDVHCATHRGAANGWVVVAGTRYPQRPCPIRIR
jgi:hypothetical protein